MNIDFVQNTRLRFVFILLLFVFPGFVFPGFVFPGFVFPGCDSTAPSPSSTGQTSTGQNRTLAQAQLQDSLICGDETFELTNRFVRREGGYELVSGIQEGCVATLAGLYYFDGEQDNPGTLMYGIRLCNHCDDARHLVWWGSEREEDVAMPDSPRENVPSAPLGTIERHNLQLTVAVESEDTELVLGCSSAADRPTMRLPLLVYPLDEKYNQGVAKYNRTIAPGDAITIAGNLTVPVAAEAGFQTIEPGTTGHLRLHIPRLWSDPFDALPERQLELLCAQAGYDEAPDYDGSSALQQPPRPSDEELHHIVVPEVTFPAEIAELLATAGTP